MLFDCGNRKSSQIATKALALRARGGFTLVETLMALMILVILTGIVAMGIPVAFETYTKTVNGSNAQMILSNATTELRNELGTAQDVITNGSGKVQYYLTGDGYWASIEPYAQTIDGVTRSSIVKYLYTEDPPSSASRYQDANGNDYRDYLVTVKGSASLSLTFDDTTGITFDDTTGIFTVPGLEVSEPGSGNQIASLGSYEVKNNLIRS